MSPRVFDRVRRTLVLGSTDGARPMVMEAKHWWANIQLLDRQLVDRDGRMVGNVDDVELEVDADGRAHVTALLSGPGLLWRRLGARRLGGWILAAHERISGREAPSRIPLARVANIGPHVVVSLRHEELGTFDGERWVRDHIIGHIPGSGHAPPAE
jgi:sporulation protein YlmC with PRC-barrel domain